MRIGCNYAGHSSSITFHFVGEEASFDRFYLELLHLGVVQTIGNGRGSGGLVPWMGHSAGLIGTVTHFVERKTFLLGYVLQTLDPTLWQSVNTVEPLPLQVQIPVQLRTGFSGHRGVGWTSVPNVSQGAVINPGAIDISAAARAGIGDAFADILTEFRSPTFASEHYQVVVFHRDGVGPGGYSGSGWWTPVTHATVGRPVVGTMKRRLPHPWGRPEYSRQHGGRYA